MHTIFTDFTRITATSLFWLSPRKRGPSACWLLHAALAEERTSRLRGNDRSMWLVLVTAVAALSPVQFIRARRALSQPADPHRGADPGRRRAGHHRAAAAALSGKVARPAGDRREPLRRQHDDRHRRGREGRARRPHAADRADDVHGERRLNTKLSFDLERDFEPITVLVKNPLLFAVNAKVPAARSRNSSRWRRPSPANSTTAPPAPRPRRICS